ncbi:MAG: bifunctional diaminohydroxyphosphoribosylaminopyrimidine deaminase/5-amino-6-(5-phosphoribosylamino)uracil reductase RibD [Veillonellaceae bacterium]|jgi:diaminohydroxyphosphoribosylaminopyrimidine deaminase/5-amino-6-(5-phosphoribosylamino)uracil reductase|nr:bifunctional diaminohydroxyphosphoribosylaminopyrimidine deaminase/5-amino-6-(5-phosphoribosylamino)uracil reductase RibD [Veillonellaceae bacterium]
MDTFYMRQALMLAKNSLGRTSPNPLVGAVIIRDGEVVGTGWHKKAGTPHAEIHALNQAGSLAKDATIYVTLEPCCHHGRTGPCTEALIKAGIKKAVIAMTDPNPKVAGCGIAKLRESGIEVVEGVLAAEAAKLNEVFIKWIATKMPFGVLKTAMTLDGKIATYTGHSKWITGSQARLRVHELRNTYDAIMVGIGTVLADNPELTTRLPNGGRNPVRIVVDSMARTPLSSKIITDGLARTIICVSENAPVDKIASLKSCGAEILIIHRNELGLDLRELFIELGNKNITSVLIEGGASINGSALQANIVDKIEWFIAPKIVGGIGAPGSVGSIGAATLDNAHLLEDINTNFIGEDILISAYLRNREGRDVYRTCGRIG